MNTEQLKGLSLESICDEVNHGWPGIYTAEVIVLDCSEVAVMGEDLFKRVLIKAVGYANRCMQLSLNKVGVVQVAVPVYDIQFNRAQIPTMADFSDEVLGYLKKEKPYLYMDSDCSIGKLEYVTLAFSGWDQIPRTDSFRWWLRAGADVDLNEFEDQTDLIKTVLNGLYLCEHPAGWDSWVDLKDCVSSTNWDKVDSAVE